MRTGARYAVFLDSGSRTAWMAMLALGLPTAKVLAPLASMASQSPSGGTSFCRVGSDFGDRGGNVMCQMPAKPY